MRILVDFTLIPLQRAGAGIYAENLVRRLPDFLGPDDVLFLLLQKDEVTLPPLLAGRKNVRLLFLPRVFRHRLMSMLAEQLILPWLLLYHRIDVVHTLHYSVPLWAPARRVVTFHDLTHLLWPQMHTRARRLLMPIFVRSSWRLADVILFVSASTRRDAERLLPEAKGRSHMVAPLGVGAEAFHRPSDEDLRKGLGSLGIQQPYVLFIGTIEPRKNILRLVHAFENIASRYPKHILILAGGLGWDYEPVLAAIASSPVRERIRQLGYVSEANKRVLLGGGDLLVYPSLYEGFGLPVLEAMAAGIPVVTSNVSSLPEVVGAAAPMVDPASEEQLAAAMALLLGDRDLAQTYSALGQQRAKIFSWENTAVETYKAYQAAFEHGRSSRALTAEQASRN